MKRLPVNDRIKALMQANLGDLPDVDAIAVFETVAADGQPLLKKGTIWQSAVATPSFLEGLVGAIHANKTVPFHLMHNDDVLPVGRVFHAEMVDGGVRALFYTTDQQLASNIDNSVVGDVSIGAVPAHMNCSECGWDYMGEDASIMNIIDRQCGNGHEIGQDGVHLNMNGLDSWLELSAVDNPADPGAKILPRSKSVLSQETQQRLAARGIPAEAQVLYAHFTGDQSPMNAAEFIAALAANATEIAALKASVTALTATNTELTAAQAKVTTLTASNETLTAQVATLTAQVATAGVTPPAIVTFLKEQAKRALVATGKPTDSLSDDAAALVVILEAAQKNIVNLVAGEGGRAEGTAAGGADKGARHAPASAFTTRKLLAK